MLKNNISKKIANYFLATSILQKFCNFASKLFIERNFSGGSMSFCQMPFHLKTSCLLQSFTQLKTLQLITSPLYHNTRYTFKHSLMSLNKMTVYKIIVDKMIADEMTVDKMTVDKMTVNKMAVDKMAVDKLRVDIKTVDKMTEDRMTVDRMTVDKMTMN